ncbi:MAG: DUF4881 domain-containing protein [Proteobacteria bacterium]|nr:DUF4881 domain-containing protein [Pseudomonadota bacterium]
MRTATYILLKILATIFFPAVLLMGCNDFGQVDQGRTIAFDKANKTVTIIRNKSFDPKNPDYSVLPPVNYRLPDDPAETGPEPKVGRRMNFDIDKKEITLFDPAANGFVTIHYTLVDQKDNVDSTDPLLCDPVTKKQKPFPLIDEATKTITVYSKRQKVLVTFTVPDEYAGYSPDTWDSGDEVRIYYKEAGRAKRFMNVSKTDIYKK